MDSTFVQVPEEHRGRVAQGHSWRGRPVDPWHLPALNGAGGLRSTASDLLRLLGLHLDGGHTPLHRAAALTAVPRAGRGYMAVGLGWLLRPLAGRWRQVLWHDGGTGGFRSFAGVVRESQVAAVVLASSAISVDRLGMKLLEVIDAEAPGYVPAAPPADGRRRRADDAAPV
jgi:CubicO group peptidase (beta-lactamase class C family)